MKQNELDASDRASGGLSRRDQWHAVTAGYLGWTLDAFDFFVLVFLVDVLAVQFGVPKSAIIWTLTATLACGRWAPSSLGCWRIGMAVAVRSWRM